MQEEETLYIASLLLQHYGDLLKVSRTRGIQYALPVLRSIVRDEEAIREEYKSMLDSEILGMGMEKDAQLRAVQEAQLEALELGDPKNNTVYADEIKKLISKGKSDRLEGQQMAVKGHNTNEDLVAEFIKRPTDDALDLLTAADCKKIKETLLNNFEAFTYWSFYIQMGFEFIPMDYHRLMFKFCQEIIEGKPNMHRTVINIPPRGGKTQIISICLPLYSFCHNAGSHNMLLSFNESVVLESSGYIRQIMTDAKFQRIFPECSIDQAKRSLDKWGTTKAGVLHAITGSGKVTGRGAGSLSTVFSGIQCIDDILKPLDAYSATERAKVNDNYTNTLLSRLACDGFEKDGKYFLPTPQVIIMQRLKNRSL